MAKWIGNGALIAVLAAVAMVIFVYVIDMPTGNGERAELEPRFMQNNPSWFFDGHL